MRRESSTLRQYVHGLAQTGETNAKERSSEGVVAPDAGAAAEQHQAPPPPSTEEYWTFVEAEFVQETVDPSWNAARQLKKDLVGFMKGATVRALECRSSMCRLETSHPDAESYSRFTEFFRQIGEGAPGWEGGAVFKILREPTPGASDLLAVTYLARRDLPAFVHE